MLISTGIDHKPKNKISSLKLSLSRLLSWLVFLTGMFEVLSNLQMKWSNLPSLSARKILAPGEEENLELEEEEDAAAGAGSTEAFPPRASGTAHMSITVNQTLDSLCHVVGLSRPRRAVWLCVFFVLSIGAVHGFIAHSCPLHLQLRKVRRYRPAASELVL